jgi:predicted alpha/beta hydrolase
MPTATEVRIETADNCFLLGRLHGPASAPRTAVLLNGGAAFPAQYYQDFAAWLSATHAAAVLTYDYRDFGWSSTAAPSASGASLCDWGIKDQSAALSFLAARYPDLSLSVIGHSLGGQWLAFHKDVARIARVAAVASGPGYWLDHPWPMLARAILFWWLVGPAAAAASGYLPGKRIGLGADIPAGVYWEWRRLCLRRDYHRRGWGVDYPQPALAEARFHLALVPIADDIMIAPHMVRKLPRFYPSAEVSETLIDPAALGLHGVGHGGAFLSRNQACWPLIAAALFG